MFTLAYQDFDEIYNFKVQLANTEIDASNSTHNWYFTSGNINYDSYHLDFQRIGDDNYSFNENYEADMHEINNNGIKITLAGLGLAGADFYLDSFGNISGCQFVDDYPNGLNSPNADKIIEYVADCDYASIFYSQLFNKIFILNNNSNNHISFNGKTYDLDENVSVPFNIEISADYNTSIENQYTLSAYYNATFNNEPIDLTRISLVDFSQEFIQINNEEKCIMLSDRLPSGEIRVQFEYEDCESVISSILIIRNN